MSARGCSMTMMLNDGEGDVKWVVGGNTKEAEGWTPAGSAYTYFYIQTIVTIIIISISRWLSYLGKYNTGWVVWDCYKSTALCIWPFRGIWDSCCTADTFWNISCHLQLENLRLGNLGSLRFLLWDSCCIADTFWNISLPFAIGKSGNFVNVCLLEYSSHLIILMQHLKIKIKQTWIRIYETTWILNLKQARWALPMGYLSSSSWSSSSSAASSLLTSCFCSPLPSLPLRGSWHEMHFLGAPKYTHKKQAR